MTVAGLIHSRLYTIKYKLFIKLFIIHKSSYAWIPPSNHIAFFVADDCVDILNAFKFLSTSKDSCYRCKAYTYYVETFIVRNSATVKK